MNDRPQPLPTADSAPYWQAALQGKLLLPKCNACSRLHFYPRNFCIHCGSRDLDWADPRGTGKIYTFTINHRPANAFMKARVPYSVAIVELDEGPRLLANIVDTPSEKIKCDARVQVVFERISNQISLPQFRVVD